MADRRRRAALPGVLVAGGTALISGLSVFVNSYGVHAVTSPAGVHHGEEPGGHGCPGRLRPGCVAHSTAATGSAAGRFVSVDRGRAVPGAGHHGIRELGPLQWIGLAYVGVIGGGLAFVLFFDGLADTTATPAAFWRDTLVIWVAVLAVPFLHERIRWWNMAAIALLVVGEVVVAGGAGHLAASTEESSSSSARRCCGRSKSYWPRFSYALLPRPPCSVVRMGIGAIALLGYLAAPDLHVLFALDATQVAWALLTGLLLAAYVAPG